jgi:hypothetical protein
MLISASTNAIGWTTTNGTIKMLLDASGNLGIGTSSPAYKIDALGSSTNGSGIVTTLRLQNSGVNSGDGTKILFTAGTSTDGAGIGSGGVALNSADLRFFTGGNTERMRVNAGAPILCFSGGNTSATGTGIAFPATQSASSDANTLDDYEEGTWTPVDSSGSGLTFTGVSAYYTKIGDMVFATFALVFPATSSSANNVIGGLPFTSATGTAMNAFNVSYTSYSPGVMSLIDSNAITFTLYDTTTTNAINNTALLSKLVRGTCIYKVA